jgi:protein-glutamine gamma-glutamyltransferase
VKNSDAHAWSEVFENGAWQRLDATPGAMASSAQAEAMRAARAEDSSWDARFDSLRVLWYRRIVNFDQRAQAEMIEKVRGLTVDTGGAIRDVLNELSAQLKAWIKRPWDMRRVSRTAFWVVLAGGLAWAVARILPWLWLQARSLGGERNFDPVRHEAGQWLRRIAEFGAAGAESAGLTGVRDELRRLRYGPRETWPEPRGIFRQARRELRAARG